MINTKSKIIFDITKWVKKYSVKENIESATSIPTRSNKSHLGSFYILKTTLYS